MQNVPHQRQAGRFRRIDFASIEVIPTPFSGGAEGTPFSGLGKTRPFGTTAKKMLTIGEPNVSVAPAHPDHRLRRSPAGGVSYRADLGPPKTVGRPTGVAARHLPEW